MVGMQLVMIITGVEVPLGKGLLIALVVVWVA